MKLLQINPTDLRKSISVDITVYTPRNENANLLLETLLYPLLDVREASQENHWKSLVLEDFQ